MIEQVDWGDEAVERLIPHRAPFRFLGRIHAWSMDEPFLHGSLEVEPDDPIVAGHFPGEPIWPGVCTIEGLAQACAALSALLAGAEASGRGGRSVLAAVNVRLIAPVLPPAHLEYRVWLGTQLAGVRSFRVEASVGAALVARGTLTAGHLPGDG